MDVAARRREDFFAVFAQLFVTYRRSTVSSAVRQVVVRVVIVNFRLQPDGARSNSFLLVF